MRLLVLGGTLFLGRHVVDAALRRGHEVATFTRGTARATPVPGVRDLRGDRHDPPSLAAALDGRSPQGVVDTSCQSRAAADQAAATVADVEASAERTLTSAIDGPVLLARAVLIVGPYDHVGRLGWWLRRLAAGGRVVVPENLDQPITLVDARDLVHWLVRAVEHGRGGDGWSGGVDATGPAGTTTLGDLLAAGVEEWLHLPLWVPAPAAATLWDVSTQRARETGLASRPVRESVADTRAWPKTFDTPPLLPGRPSPGLPVELERTLLAGR